MSGGKEILASDTAVEFLTLKLFCFEESLVLKGLTHPANLMTFQNTTCWRGRGEPLCEELPDPGLDLQALDNNPLASTEYPTLHPKDFNSSE